MKINPIISAILRHKWAIDTQYALNAGSIISGLLSGNEFAEISEPKPMAAIIAGDGKAITYRDWDTAPQGSIALVNLKGTLIKDNASCGPVGMAEIGKRIQEADNDPRFKGILLHIDSPGGTIDGTESLANIVKSTKKPILSFVDGLMASAALWVGSSADEVWASTTTDEIGSIGVLLSFADVQPYYEKMGVKFHLITASSSNEKVKYFKDLKAGNYENYIKEVLDPLDTKFMEAVKSNRPNVRENHLTGKVFFAKDVMGVLVDQIGTIGEAIQHLASMTDLTGNKSNSIQSNMKTFKTINQVLGVDSLESDEDHVSLHVDQMNLLEKALGATDNDLQEAANLKDANKALREENDSLKKAAAGGSSAAITKNDETGEDKKKEIEGAVVSENDDFATGLNKIHDEIKNK